MGLLQGQRELIDMKVLCEKKKRLYKYGLLSVFIYMMTIKFPKSFLKP